MSGRPSRPFDLRRTSTKITTLTKTDNEVKKVDESILSERTLQLAEVLMKSSFLSHAERSQFKKDPLYVRGIREPGL